MIVREIKFRAWCLDNKWMEECFYLQAHNGVVFDTPSRTYDTPNIEVEENPNLVVMQFIGLQDINGKDIYEGDVISITYHGTNSTSKYGPKQVKWDSEKCGFNISRGIDCEVIEMFMDSMAAKS